MLGALRNPPRVVTVRVNKASGLRNVYAEAKKHRKDNCKWKVKIKGGKKTMESYTINDQNGNPTWDFEATFEIVDVSQPVVIKVTDSDDHHVGQVVIPLVQIPPRPSGPSAKPATPANLRVAELEPTKKVSEVYGSLYYWIWAESYYDGVGPEKSSKASLVSSDRIHRSASRISSHLHRHRDNDDRSSMAGSSLSMYSTASGKKKHWYQKNPIKHIHDRHSSGASHLGSKHGSELGYSMSQSMSSLFPAEHDGSILGGRSGNGSDISAGSNAVSADLDPKIPKAENPFPRVGSNNRMVRPPLSSKVGNNPETVPKRPIIPSERPKRRSEQVASLNPTEKAPSSASSDEGDDVRTQPHLATPLSTQEPPSLLSISPSTGSPNSETEVHVFGKNLSDSTMRHAVLLVDDYTVANYKWSVSEGSWTEEPRATHRLTLKVPPKKDTSGSDEVWIDVETMSHGRLRCPTPFVYQVVKKLPEEKELPSNLPGAGFIRNSSIRLSDNRNRRSVRKPAEPTPLKAISPQTSEKSGVVRNSSIRLSDTRGHHSMRGAKPSPTLPSFNELPISAGNRSSGLGSEDSFSEATVPGAPVYSVDGRIKVHIDSLVDAEAVIAKLRGEVSGLTTELSRKAADVDRVSADLCRLRVRLLEDGMFNGKCPHHVTLVSQVINRKVAWSEYALRHAISNPLEGRAKEMLPTILEGRNEHSLRTVPVERAFDASSDVEDDHPSQFVHHADDGKEMLSDVEPLPNGDVKDSNEITQARSPSPMLTECLKPQLPSSTIVKLQVESNSHSPGKVEEINPKPSDFTSIEPKVSSPGFRSPSPMITDAHYGNDYNLSTVKEVEEPRTPSPVIVQVDKSQPSSFNAAKLQSESDYHASPLKQPAKTENCTVDDDGKSSRSSCSAEIKTEERPDPIGGVATVQAQQYGEEKATTNLAEAEETTSESGDSTDYSLDSARGDSLLPTVDENFYLNSRVHPRFILMKPSEGSTAGSHSLLGDYEVCLYGVHLDEAVMLHAQVFIDIYNVTKENWRVVPGQWPTLAPEATHCLHIHVPPMPPGEAWIEIETLNDGRLQSPRPFVFTDNFSVKHSMRGVGGRVTGTPLPANHQPAPSFADFELSPKEGEGGKVAASNCIAVPFQNVLLYLHVGSFESIDIAKQEISKLYSEIAQLKVELQEKAADEARVARELCVLRTRLLEDGQLKYLERN
ncbi:unnamed protein product [Hydatigera taeniaeformis]|uniref:C2 domain-containing protein n=1 Tax=Hydatigena taeniaeformis TaxID=6205 RepID=A0A158RE28_HYDTA|nr:unnamed protein product [Hydatigera taeniaeformis]